MIFNLSNVYYGFQLEILLINYWHQWINYNEFNIFVSHSWFHLRFKIGFQKNDMQKKISNHKLTDANFEYIK